MSIRYKKNGETKIYKEQYDIVFFDLNYTNCIGQARYVFPKNVQVKPVILTQVGE